ncbi:MAG TPA: SMI1/KNR4 family protein [Hymenobacter sp.]|jgi:hypothetical protein
MDSLSELNTLWEKAKIKSVVTATEEQLKNFEESYKLKLPQDLRDYFANVNGTEGESDDGFFTFCTFNQFQSIQQVLRDWYGVPKHSDIIQKIDHSETCYVFADYSICLFAYAIRLHHEVGSENEVYAICGGEYRIIAKSFSEFINLYLQKSDQLTF